MNSTKSYAKSLVLGGFPVVFSIGLFTSSNVLYETLEMHCFTKLAVSWLIMVRFEKFKIWHAQGSDADLSDVTVTSRVRRRARGRHAREDVSSDIIMTTITSWGVVAMGCCYGPISITAGWILLIFGRKTDMAKKAWHTRNCHHNSNIKGTGQFLLNTMATVLLPWKPMPLGSAQSRSRPPCRVWGRSVQKRRSR